MKLTIGNSASHPKTIGWVIEEAPLPSALNPQHRDLLRGDHGPHIVRRHVTIKVGGTAEIDADVLSHLRQSDPVVRAWFDSGELTIVG